MVRSKADLVTPTDEKACIRLKMFRKISYKLLGKSMK